jgi:hypothetical protein
MRCGKWILSCPFCSVISSFSNSIVYRPQRGEKGFRIERKKMGERLLVQHRQHERMRKRGEVGVLYLKRSGK